jgi:hypothetical protein
LIFFLSLKALTETFLKDFQLDLEAKPAPLVFYVASIRAEMPYILLVKKQFVYYVDFIGKKYRNANNWCIPALG